MLKFGHLFGPNYVSRNVNGILHFINDVRQFGNLNDISAFRFANFMRHLKTLLRKPEFPLAQISKRYGEIKNTNVRFSHLRKKENPSLKNEYFNDSMIPNVCERQYQK